MTPLTTKRALSYVGIALLVAASLGVSTALATQTHNSATSVYTIRPETSSGKRPGGMVEAPDTPLPSERGIHDGRTTSSIHTADRSKPTSTRVDPNAPPPTRGTHNGRTSKREVLDGRPSQRELRHRPQAFTTPRQNRAWSTIALTMPRGRGRRRQT